MRIPSIVALALLWTYSQTATAGYHKCHETILTSTCLVKGDYIYDKTLSDLDNIRARQNMKCLEGSDVYAQELYTLFPSLPNHTKSAFCHIKKIYIVPGDTIYGAKALRSYDLKKVKYTTEKFSNDVSVKMASLKPNGFIMKISKEARFDIRETEEEFETRVYQMYFGVDVYRDGYSSELPKYIYEGDKMRSALYSTIVHEVGHFFDYSGNYSGSLVWNQTGDKMVSTSKWFNLSWEVVEEKDDRGYFFFKGAPLVPNELKLKGIVPEYHYKASEYRQITRQLRDSAFVSFYSMANKKEDFAEIYKAITMRGNLRLIQDGETLIDNSKRPNPILQQKMDYMRKLLKNGFEKIYEQKPHMFPIETSSL